MANENLMAIIDKALETYKVGGAFSKQRGEQLKTAQKKYTTGAQAGLTSRGLSGTTIAASIPAAFEQEIGAQFRTETERLRSGQEMQGLLAKAGFLEADKERQLRLTIAERDAEAREYAASMSAAGQVHSGAGGGSGGGGSAAGMIASWGSNLIDRGGRLGFGGTSGGGTTTGAAGTARQHTGTGSGSFRGGGGGGSLDVQGVFQATGTGQTEQIVPGSTPAQPVAKTLPEGAIGQDENWTFYEYYPGGPQYSINKKTGGKRY